MPDISAELANDIATAKTSGSSENIRCGRYKFVVKKVHADVVENDKGKHKFVFVEVVPLESLPNLQTVGNINAEGKLLDDGNNPNPVGSECAMKVDFDGAGGRSAAGNVKQFILGLFGKADGEISEAQLNETWRDISRTTPLKKGDTIGISPQNQPILSDRDKPANPLYGMVVGCVAFAKRKQKIEGKTPDQHYITKLNWTCISPPGIGENAPDVVAKRRLELESRSVADDDDADDAASPVSPPSNGAAAAALAPVLPPPVAFPPPGWFTNGVPEGYFHNGKEVLKEADLRQRLGL